MTLREFAFAQALGAIALIVFGVEDLGLFLLWIAFLAWVVS